SGSSPAMWSRSRCRRSACCVTPWRTRLKQLPGVVPAERITGTAARRVPAHAREPGPMLPQVRGRMGPGSRANALGRDDSRRTSRRSLLGSGAYFHSCGRHANPNPSGRPGVYRPMAKLQLTFASALYDRMQPIYTGEVPVDGIDLNFIRIEQPRPIFDRMSGGEEFDVAEYSSSEYVQRYANKKCNFAAIPVFPSRCSRHSFIGVNTNKIKKPKDLEGKRIGVALYTMTAAIFIRGILQHDHGVDFSNCIWVQGAINEKGAHG